MPSADLYKKAKYSRLFKTTRTTMNAFGDFERTTDDSGTLLFFRLWCNYYKTNLSFPLLAAAFYQKLVKRK